jgi:beta-glucosidase
MPNPSFSQIVAFWQTPSDWLFVVPSGMRKILGWIRERYNNPIIYITENGRISSSLLAAVAAVADATVSLLGNDIS